MQNLERNFLVVLATSLALVACGGGGGSSPATPAPTTPAPSAPTTPASSSSSSTAPVTDINFSNQDQIGAIGLKGAEAVISFAGGTAADSSTTTASTASEPAPYLQAASSNGAAFNLEQLLQQSIAASTNSDSTGFGPSALAPTSSTTKCTSGGSYTTTNTVTSTTVSTVGDISDVTYNNCIEKGFTTNGNATAKVTALATANSGKTQQLTYNNIQSKSSTTSIVYNGSFNFASKIRNIVYDYPTFKDTAYSFNYVVSNGTITGEFQSAGYSGTLSMANITTTTDIHYTGTVTSTPIKVDISATVSGEPFGINVENLTPIVKTSSGAFISGKLKLTGKRALLYITLLGSGALKLELDSDGDGIIDGTKSTTISALNAP